MIDVLIIGAGPSGSVSAALLAQRGFKVLVLERQRFPRFSIGESLLSQSVQLLDEAGLLETLQAGDFQYKNGAAFAHNGRYVTFNFAEKSSPGAGYAFHVLRSDFDHRLIKAAEQRGAEVEYETEIIGATFGEEGPVVTARNAQGVERTLRPRFVLDASGFGRTLPRLLDLEMPSTLPQRCALFTQIHDRIPAGAFDRQKTLITTHPKHRDVWYWLIPFSNGVSSMGVVALPEMLERYPGTNDDKLWALTREVPELRELLGSPEQLFPANQLRGYSAKVKHMHGPGYALLGNAAEFLDPIFSSGVTIALKSARLATDLLARQLQGETVDWVEDFEQPLKQGVETFRGFVEGWYDGSLQDIIYFEPRDPKVQRYICAILAGYGWDPNNPYVGKAKHRLGVLAQHCRDRMAQQQAASSEAAAG